jgi:hypothetical protein
VLISELGAYLAAQGLGIVGTDIALGSEPDTPDNVLTIYETPGYPPHAGLEDVTRTFQIRSRAKGYSTLNSRAWAAYAALRGVIQTPGGLRIRCRPIQTPGCLGKDDRERWIIVFNLEVVSLRD